MVLGDKMRDKNEKKMICQFFLIKSELRHFEKRFHVLSRGFARADFSVWPKSSVTRSERPKQSLDEFKRKLKTSLRKNLITFFHVSPKLSKGPPYSETKAEVGIRKVQLSRVMFFRTSRLARWASCWGLQR